MLPTGDMWACAQRCCSTPASPPSMRSAPITLAGIPGYEFAFVAEKAGPVSNGGSFTMEAQMSIDELAHVDVLVVPGGVAAIGMARRGHVLVDWIREMHPNTQWTTSVCTGALLLGAAGALRDLPATTHWYSHAELADYGAIPTDARVVEHGKVITSAGVSAGIDMSLVLVERIMGTEYAQAAQLDMEYDPAPPFDAGHPRSAPPAVTAWLKGMYDDMLGG